MKRGRRLYAILHYSRFLLHEFRWPLGVLVGLVFGGGLLLSLTYTRERQDFFEASYNVFLLIFLQPSSSSRTNGTSGSSSLSCPPSAWARSRTPWPGSAISSSLANSSFRSGT